MQDLPRPRAFVRCEKKEPNSECNSCSITFLQQETCCLELPTSRAQNVHEREARAVDFLCFSAEKPSERARGQLPEPEMRSEGL